MSDSKSPFEKYGSKVVPLEQPASAAESGKTPYKAADLDAPRSAVDMMRLEFPKGRIDLVSYADLRRVICVTPQAVALVLSDGAILLTGRKLTGLLDGLQDRRILCLRYFDAARFAPAEEGEPVITGIESTTVQELLNAG